jgi:hypothetical protein
MTSNEWPPTAYADTAPGVFTEEEVDARRAEQRQASYAFLRHLMTLDAGALVLTVALIEHAFAQPAHRAAVAVAVCAFLVSLATGGFASVNLLTNHPRAGAPRMSSSDRRSHTGAMLATLLAFFVGMGALTWFFYANWLR